MRVAVVTERYLPHIGGVEYSVGLVGRSLSDMGVELEIFTAEPLRQRGTVVSSGISVHNMATVPFVSGSRFPVGLLGRIPGKFDVVHAHNYHSLATAAMRHDYGAKRVFTPHFHGEGSTRFLDALHYPYRFVASRWLRGVDAVICVSRLEAEKFGAAFPALAGRVAIIPAPLRQRFPTGPLSSGSRSLLCVGRLVPYKRFDLAIAALALLPSWTLSIAGEGPDRHRLERHAVSLGVSSRVRFVGRVDDVRLGRLIDEAACLIQLSVLEAFGMTVLEAIASGRPVVVALGGAPAELGEYFPDWVVETELTDLAVAAAVSAVTTHGPRGEPDARPFEPRQIAEAHIRLYSQ